MEVVPVLVAYHSLAWMGVAVESYLEQFPDDRLLVVDNNPKRGESGWVPDCDQERAWLAAHPHVILLDNPTLPDGVLENRTHGAGLDVALEWCRGRGARVLLHLEPDCLVHGRLWRDRLLGALDAGAWMAGSVRQCHGPLHPTPTAWLVQEVRASFKITAWKGQDEIHPRFRELMDLPKLATDTSPMGVWIGWSRYWDTAHKAWFEAAVHDRAALVETPDFKHYWHGSQERRGSAQQLARRYPELLPFLNRAQARRVPRQFDTCTYRTIVTHSRDREVACCKLVQLRSGIQALDQCSISRQACLACCESFAPAREQLNPVVASLLYELAERTLEHGGVPGLTKQQAAQLRDEVEQELQIECTA